MRTSILVLSVSIAAFSTPVVAEPVSYSTPRNAHGHPDFEGTWTNTNATPFVRAPGYTQLIISDAQAREIDLRRIAQEEDRSRPTEPTEWSDERQVEPVNGTLRSSIIIDPVDGQLPANEALRKRIAAVPGRILHAMDGPEERPNPERCLGSVAAQPPILSIPITNLHLIVQTADTTVFFSEWLHEARVIRMNAKHVHPAITSWLGDSIGWWDGDTLVVETKYFTPSDRMRTSASAVFAVSPLTTLTERFTRVAEEEIVYRFTVEDPTWYERPWTGETHFMQTDEQILEAACHEGNYNVRFMLEAARASEAAR